MSFPHHWQFPDMTSPAAYIHNQKGWMSYNWWHLQTNYKKEKMKRKWQENNNLHITCNCKQLIFFVYHSEWIHKNLNQKPIMALKTQHLNNKQVQPYSQTQSAANKKKYKTNESVNSLMCWSYLEKQIINREHLQMHCSTIRYFNSVTGKT